MRRPFFALSLFVLASSIVACGESTPPPQVPKVVAKPARGPFGALKLPASARGVWIVYRETWATESPEDDGVNDGGDASKAKGPRPTLKSRVLVSITMLKPEADGVIVPPDDTPLGLMQNDAGQSFVRAHAIVWAPGYGVFDWDSHAFGSTPNPKANPPIAERTTNKEPEGCESVEAVGAIFRDFAPGTKTGLPKGQFVQEMTPPLGALLAVLTKNIGDPNGPAANDYDDTDPTDEPNPSQKDPKVRRCEGFGRIENASMQKIEAIVQWANMARDGGYYDTDSQKKQVVPAPSASLDGPDRWEAAIGWVATNQAGAKDAASAALASKDPETRKAGLFVTGALGDAGAPIGKVIPLLDDPDAMVAAWASAALSRLPPPGPDAVPSLVDLIGSETTGDAQASYAISILGQMGANAKSAAMPLAKVAKEGKGKARGRAMHALVALGVNASDAAVPIAELIREDEVGPLSVDAFAAMKAGGKDAVPTLTDALGDANVEVKTRASSALAYIGKASKPAAAVLTKLVDPTAPPTLRIAAMRALGEIGPDAGGAAERVIKQLEDASAEVRRTAVTTLGLFGAKGAPAVKGLTVLVERDPDMGVRRAAATSLGQIGAAARPAVPTLLKLVENEPDDSLRRNAAYAIVDMGPSSAGDVPKLVEAVKKKSAYWVSALIERTSTMGKAVVPYLTKFLDSKAYDEQRAAILALGQIGKDAAPAVPEMVKMFDKNVAPYDVLNALGNIGTGASAAVPTLVTHVEKNNFRYDALRILPKIGAAAIGPMTKLMKDPKKDVGLRQEVANSILDAGPAAAPAIKDVLETWDEVHPYWVPLDRFTKIGKAAALPLATATKDARPGVKHRATQALGYLGKDGAPEAIPALVVAMKDPVLRSEALESIRRYGKDVAKPILEKLAKDKTKEAEANEAIGALA